MKLHLPAKRNCNFCVMLTLTSSVLQPTLLEMFLLLCCCMKKRASRGEKICNWVMTDVLSVWYIIRDADSGKGRGGLYVLEVNNRD